MKPPIFVRTLSKNERQELEAGLRSSDAFVLRRCQILLASARRERAPRIAENLGCGSQTVRNAIHSFNERGLDALQAGSSRPREVHAAFDHSGGLTPNERTISAYATAVSSILACSYSDGLR
jgi:hypothetical protein